MSRIAAVLRTAIPVFAIAAAFVVFYSLEMTVRRPGLLSNPPELRAKNHTLSLALHAAITSDGKNSFYFNGQPNAPILRLSTEDHLHQRSADQAAGKLRDFSVHGHDQFALSRSASLSEHSAG